MEATCKFDPCDRPVQARQLCSGHYKQQNQGKPLTPIRPKTPNGMQNEAVARGLAGGAACVETVSPNQLRPVDNSGGRGAPRTSLARTVYTLKHGDPGDLWVLHMCANDRCVNVDHLYAGTPKDNTADREAVYQLGLAVLQGRMAGGGPAIRQGRDHYF